MRERRSIRPQRVAVGLLGVAVAVGLVVGCSRATQNAAAPAASPTSLAATPKADGGAATAGEAATATPALDGSPAEVGRKVVSTATLKVSTDDLAAGKGRAAEAVRELGGFVYGEQSELSGTARVTVTYKVPPEHFDEALTRLAGLGTLQSQEIKTDDVTTKVVDLDARIAAAEASLDRLRGLYAKAGTVTELAALENEVARREADLESLRGQARTLDRQVELATVQLTLTSAVATAGAQQARDLSAPGFVEGLRRGWDAYVGAVGWTATVVGALLPFVVAVAVVVLPATWLLGRRHRRRDAVPMAT